MLVFLRIHHLQLSLLFGPLEASPFTRHVKMKDTRAIKIEAMTPASCPATGCVPLLNEYSAEQKEYSFDSNVKIGIITERITHVGCLSVKIKFTQ